SPWHRMTRSRSPSSRAESRPPRAAYSGRSSPHGEACVYPMIITIDGPAGAGKSSAARGLARRLGFDFLDTGAMYRAVALAALRTGTDLADHKGLAALLANLHLEVPP